MGMYFIKAVFMITLWTGDIKAYSPQEKFYSPEQCEAYIQKTIRNTYANDPTHFVTYMTGGCVAYGEHNGKES